MSVRFDRVQIRNELDEKGWCVVPGVIGESQCDDLKNTYIEWLKQFKKDDWPNHMNSVIQQYNIGHFEATWIARLKSKQVFKEIWQTDKLLTSCDGVALSPPPELGSFAYAVPGGHWFHLDQGAIREGIHAFQGAVYLEETTETDYVFRVLEKSHKHHKEFFETFHKAAIKSSRHDFYKLTTEEFDWYKSMGCIQRRIPVPKGGMVLWDSRTIHDNNRPEKGRHNTDRWRSVVFTCMTPAKWAKPDDIATKRTSYKRLLMTTHWPSQKVDIFDDDVSSHDIQITRITSLPDIAATDEVKLLSGVIDYDFEDGKSNGPDEPKWITFADIGITEDDNDDVNDYPTDGPVPAWKNKNKYNV